MAEVLEARKQAEKSPASIDQCTRELIDKSAGHYLAAVTIFTPLGPSPTKSWDLHVEEFVTAQLGSDPSPAMRLMAEQALILHHASSALRTASAGITDQEITKNNNSLANQMATEVRRFLAALEEARTQDPQLAAGAAGSPSAGAALRKQVA